MNANPLNTVGLMLTLAGLVGSFFNIQLSQWLRDLIALEQKIKLNKSQGTPEQMKAIVECKIEHQKLDSNQTYIINISVMVFVSFVLIDGLTMIGFANRDPIYPHVMLALWVFLLYFLITSGWLLFSGWSLAREANNSLLSSKP